MVELCAQTFGRPGDPAVLLIAGVGSSMDWWEDGFCTALADGGRFVIRYDARDTGQSVHYPVGAPDYGSRELVGDAVALLDRYGVGSACVLGISSG
ncbi:MAG TPA: alpha/beta hydrolase, partial [Mycobacteriales bacterium]|nr:alpha/beta hydrolase [Mycobacteriales bacterium]